MEMTEICYFCSETYELNPGVHFTYMPTKICSSCYDNGKKAFCSYCCLLVPNTNLLGLAFCLCEFCNEERRERRR